ncbi:hypothetical protein QT973_24625 [Microcoleus sp. Z1_A1]|uniref:hypothetical protein n=1 Tax=unclassified Microcoleus TaxID=2642155 RepID=UPI002FD7119F
MTIFLPWLQFNNLTGLGLFATLCHSPNQSEFMLIVAAVIGMVGALVVLVPASAVTMIFMATTIVQMIMAGATLESIAAAIAAQLGAVGISLGLVSQLVEQIKGIMGC